MEPLKLSLIQALEFDAIRSDAAFAGRFAQEVMQHSQLGPILTLGTIPFWSLIVHESHRYLERNHPGIASSLEYDHRPAIEKSRHSIKLLDQPDTVRQLIETFNDGTLVPHSDFFLNTRFKWASRLAKDLGIYRYNGNLIATTHSASVGLGGSSARFFEEDRAAELRERGYAYGRYLASLAPSDIDRPTDPPLPLNDDSLTMHDVRASQFLSSAATGPVSPEGMALLGLLACCWSFLAFAVQILGLDDSPGAKQSRFKLRYIALYQTVTSIDVLAASLDTPLSIRPLIEALHELDGREFLTDEGGRSLRRTLVHYEFDHDIRDDELDSSRPLYGLVERSFSGLSFNHVDGLIDELATRHLDIFETSFKQD